MTVIALLEMSIDPKAGNVDEILRHDLPNTASFPGNEGTEVLADETDPTKFLLVTRWISQESFDAYAAWRQSPEGATRLSEISSRPPISRHFRSYMTF